MSDGRPKLRIPLGIRYAERDPAPRPLLLTPVFAQLGLAGLQEPIFSDRTTMAPYTPTSAAGPAATGAAGVGAGSGASVGTGSSAGGAGGASGAAGADSAAGAIRASSSASGKSGAVSAAPSSAGFIDFPTTGALAVPFLGAAIALYL